MKQTKFARFVADFGGTHYLAEKLGYNEKSVSVWVRGKGSPKSLTISKLIKLSGGALTFEDILRDTSKNTGRK